MENGIDPIKSQAGQAILELLLVLAAILLMWNTLLPAGKAFLNSTKKELLSKE
jgi:hypothetical protein